jgi:tRNA(fMet)-specific endonuclease VapC
LERFSSNNQASPAWDWKELWPSAGRKLTAHTKNTTGLSIITLCELQYGIELHAARHPQLRARNKHLLSMMAAPSDVFPLDHRVVDPYSEVRAALANAPIGPLDALIAAQALSLGAILVTGNVKELQRVPTLVVEDWR